MYERHNFKNFDFFQLIFQSPVQIIASYFLGSFAAHITVNRQFCKISITEKRRDLRLDTVIFTSNFLSLVDLKISFGACRIWLTVMPGHILFVNHRPLSVSN